MKSGVCTKCGCQEVYTNRGKFMKRGPFGIGTMPVTFWTASEMTAYVCGRCGYMDRYLDLEGRMTARRKWPRVSPRPAADGRALQAPEDAGGPTSGPIP